MLLALFGRIGNGASHGQPWLYMTGEMPPDRLVCHSAEPLVPTIAALYARLFADPLHPFVRACRLIACLATLSALKAAWIDVRATTKESAEQSDLHLRRRAMVDHRAVLSIDRELSSNWRLVRHSNSIHPKALRERPEIWRNATMGANQEQHLHVLAIVLLSIAMYKRQFWIKMYN